MTRTESDPLQLLIAEHGARRVLMAALKALLTARTARIPDVDSLPDHIRQDIGLPPQGHLTVETPFTPRRW